MPVATRRGVVRLLIVASIALAGCGSASNQSAGTSATPASTTDAPRKQPTKSTPATADGMTLTTYDAIKLGMTLDEVTRLVGSPGTLATRPTKTERGEFVEARNWGSRHPDVHGSTYVVFIDHIVTAKGQNELE